MDLPSSVRFLHRVERDVSTGRNVLVLLPSSQGLADDVADCLERICAASEVVPLDELPLSQSPSATLGDALGVSWVPEDTPRNPVSLARTRGMPPTLLLTGWSHLNVEDQASWLDFLVRWSNATRLFAEAGGDSSKICIIAEGYAFRDRLPKEDLSLSVRYWWGLPSGLEIRLLCRDDYKNHINPQARWREHVIPALAAGDPTLISPLWDAVCATWGEVQSALRSVARERGWTPQVLKELQVSGLPSATYDRFEDDSVPLCWHPLWVRGMAHWTAEQGVELNSAVLAATKRDHDLQRRIWRGQVTFLLSLLEDVRMRLCQRLTDQRPKWATEYELPLLEEERDAVLQDPIATQWGHLCFVLHNSPCLSVENSIRRLANRARQLRNSLAHGTPVSFDDYFAFQREVEQLV